MKYSALSTNNPDNIEKQLCTSNNSMSTMYIALFVIEMKNKNTQRRNKKCLPCKRHMQKTF